MTTAKPQLLLTLDDNFLKQIEDYRFANRINSRSEAMRRLIEAGLKSESSKPKSKKK